MRSRQHMLGQLAVAASLLASLPESYPPIESTEPRQRKLNKAEKKALKRQKRAASRRRSVT